MPCTNKYNKNLCPYCSHRESCKVYTAKEKEFEQLEWLLRNRYYKPQAEE